LLIDPFTVVAQIINFALLVWLLRRFLYGPVTRVMRTREERIRAETEDARQLREAAAAEGEQYRRLTAEFESDRERRLAETRAELEAMRLEQARVARAEVEALRARWQHGLEQERAAFVRELRRRVGHESLAVIRQALREMADTEIEARLVTRFTERLATLDSETRERIRTAARDAGARQPVVRTAFPLSAEQEMEVRRAVGVAAAYEGDMRFETDPALVAGVELRAGGWKVAWAIDDYLQSLEDAMSEMLAAEPIPDRGRD